MRTGRGNHGIWRKLAPVSLCLPKSHINWPETEPGLLQWDANDHLPELWHVHNNNNNNNNNTNNNNNNREDHNLNNHHCEQLKFCMIQF
jgi:hypothetical protein